MSEIKLSVVVCTHNRANLLAECLSCLAAQTIDKNLCEIIVVNNNCTDNTDEVVESFISRNSNFRLILENKKGLSNARNKGWREAKGKYICYIDDDAKAVPELCELVLKSFESIEPQPVAVGGQAFPWYESQPPDWFLDEFEIRTWGDRAKFLDHPQAKYGFSGLNMSFLRSVLEKYGGFSNEYGMIDKETRMGEDTEFFCRIYDKEKYFWYDPNIIVHHWCPNEKMKITNRLLRAYKCGEALAFIDQKKICSFANFIKIAAISFLIVRLPVVLAMKARLIKSELYKQTEKICYVLGYLKINI